MLSSLPDRLRDPGRLAALRRSALLDSPTEEAFDRLTRLASRLLQAPVVLVSLIDIDRQFFKSAVGLPEPVARQRSTPLSYSFCQHVVASGEELLIENAGTHPLVCNNLAVPELGVIAYAGMPLVTSDGHVLGSFCAIDYQPRTWTEEETNLLRDLAASVTTAIELRIAEQVIQAETRGRERAMARLQQSEEHLRAVLAHTPSSISTKDRAGRYLVVNDLFCRCFGVTQEQVIGKTDFDVFSFDVAREMQKNDARVIDTGQPLQQEETIPCRGVSRIYLSERIPLHDSFGAIYAVCTVSTDITARPV